MPTVLSHAVAATAIGAAMIPPPRLPVWGLGALCAVLPDLDVIAFALGLRHHLQSFNQLRRQPNSTRAMLLRFRQ